MYSGYIVWRLCNRVWDRAHKFDIRKAYELEYKLGRLAAFQVSTYNLLKLRLVSSPYSISHSAQYCRLIADISTLGLYTSPGFTPVDIYAPESTCTAINLHTMHYIIYMYVSGSMHYRGQRHDGHHGLRVWDTAPGTLNCMVLTCAVLWAPSTSLHHQAPSFRLSSAACRSSCSCWLSLAKSYAEYRSLSFCLTYICIMQHTHNVM